MRDLIKEGVKERIGDRSLKGKAWKKLDVL
jgi:hypothetical protein